MLSLTEDFEVHHAPLRKRRFSSESINDLLFWAVHLCVVAVALAIVWSKIDSTNQALGKLLRAQEEEVTLTRTQTAAAQEQLAFAKEFELKRSAAVASVLTSVGQIQADVNATLDQVREINKSMLELMRQSKAAAEVAAQAGAAAAGASSRAAGAASAAAGSSASTKAYIARKVVTTEDKAQILAQERALAAKKQQLNRTIKQVKKRGPTVWQQLFH